MRIFVFILFLVLYNCFTPKERNCLDFKTGSFISEIKVKDSLYKSSFTRTYALQVEHYNAKIDSSTVRWINDCEAVFKTINPKRLIDKKDIHLKILSTTDSSYTFEYSYVGESYKQIGTAYKVY